jgi:peroxiredoxin
LTECAVALRCSLNKVVNWVEEMDMSDSQVGAVLPDASVVSAQGHASGLRSTVGSRPAAVFFMRASTCAVCVKHARTLAGMADELAAHGTSAVVVVPGGQPEAQAVARKVGTAVTVVASDPAAAHAAAGLDRTLFLQHSGTFLVDADGIVRYAKTATLPTGSFSADELRAAVAKHPLAD